MMNLKEYDNTIWKEWMDWIGDLFQNSLFIDILCHMLFIKHFADVRSLVGVLTSPGYSIWSPPAVSLTLCTSGLFGRISHTRLPYVTFLSLGICCLSMNLIVFVPVGILLPTPLANLSNSFEHVNYYNFKQN